MIKDLHKKIKNKEITIRQIVDECLKNIETHDKDIHAFLEIYNDIDEQISFAQKMFDEGKETLLTGIPLALKDNILRKGFTTSASSKILETYKASYDSTVVKILKEQGAIFIGRTNMDEFAMGSSTENSAFGVTLNPHDKTRVPGGSSGGPAAAVAYGGVIYALGTDTGGSIRQPASFCGVCGIYPTYGSVSRYGAIAMGSSLDQISPITKTAEDLQIVFDALAICDKNDATTLPEDIRKHEKMEVKKIGIPRNFLEGVDVEVLENFNQTIEKLKNAGNEIIDVDLKYTPYSLPVYYILMPAEVSTNLSRHDGIRYGKRINAGNIIDTYFNTKGELFGFESKRRSVLGAYVLSHGYKDAYYDKSILVREKIKNEFKEVFEKVDVIMTPTSPTVAFKQGEKSDNPLAMYLADVFTVTANIAQIPAVSIPSGKNKEGLSFGVQFIAPELCENLLFDIGSKTENLI